MNMGIAQDCARRVTGSRSEESARTRTLLAAMLPAIDCNFIQRIPSLLLKWGIDSEVQRPSGVVRRSRNKRVTAEQKLDIIGDPISISVLVGWVDRESRFPGVSASVSV